MRLMTATRTRRPPPAPPPQYLVDAAVRAALDEDLGIAGDITTQATVAPGTRAEAAIAARRPGVVAGLGLAEAAFRALDPNVVFAIETEDGEAVSAGGIIARISGDARAVLSAERVALNFLGRLSGIATLTRRYVDAIAGTNAKIVDTRKTTPGLRMLEKYAVTCGGGHNHRLGLDDGVLIKDNHIALAGNVSEAVRRARETAGHLHKIEVEVSNFDQLREALQARADIIMLDNMTPEQVREAIAIIN